MASEKPKTIRLNVAVDAALAALVLMAYLGLKSQPNPDAIPAGIFIGPLLLVAMFRIPLWLYRVISSRALGRGERLFFTFLLLLAAVPYVLYLRLE